MVLSPSFKEKMFFNNLQYLISIFKFLGQPLAVGPFKLIYLSSNLVYFIMEVHINFSGGAVFDCTDKASKEGS
jgi:hypothetical protein